LPDPYDRRSFLGQGLRTAAGLSVLGSAGSGLLAACGSSSGGSPVGSASGISHGTPKRGGTLNVGVEAEINGFNPRTARFDSTGILYARTVFDPLAAYAVDGTVKPYLAQSITHNADYTQWTITVRPNITFHDGSPLDANAVKINLDGLVASPLTGPALAPLQSTAVTGPLTVVVTMKDPWVPFPSYLTEQLGFVAAPSMFSSSNGGADNPIGTGPFVFKEWVPNGHFSASRNAKYWRHGLPYLDEVTYHPIPDTQSRDNGLKSGTLDIIHSSDTDTVQAFQHESGFQLVTDANNHVGEPDISFIMVNTANSPLNDVRLRQALAYSTDKNQVIAVIDNGLTQPVDGPFPPGTTWNGSTGYPSFDPSKAVPLVQAVEREHGPINLELGTTNTPKNLSTIQLIQQMWKRAGIQTHLVQIEQTQFINNALEGQYQVYTWRQFAAPDPDANYVWWSETNAAPIGSTSLNFARNKDPQIQSALQTGRTSSDPATRNEAYKTIAKRFGVDIPYIWLNRTLWALVGNSSTMNFNGGTLPDGSQSLPMTSGVFWVTTTWHG
jgi:peptide/nickel transport system substrate-binding protein